MDLKHLFADSRFSGFCVYCGGIPDTSDHVPSRVFLDEPFPENLPVVECCFSCNSHFSLHEEYLACFLCCVVSGSTSPEKQIRTKVARILKDSPALTSRIQASLVPTDSEELVCSPELERFQTIIVKLARGHIAYELSLPILDNPVSVHIEPLAFMSPEDSSAFLSEQQTIRWPEIGSRAFISACQGRKSGIDSWRIIQPDRYQYLVSQTSGNFVRLLIGGYLACQVYWD
jgi:hypothetical protein